MLRTSSSLAILTSLLLAGCAGTENFFTTGALGSSAGGPESADPVCVSLASRIDALRREGVPEKIEKAAAKKYKLTNADIAKADQLTKTNTEYQLHCSTVMPSQLTASAATPPAKGAAGKPAKAQEQN
jgi:hypothetical protein